MARTSAQPISGLRPIADDEWYDNRSKQRDEIFQEEGATLTFDRRNDFVRIAIVRYQTGHADLIQSPCWRETRWRIWLPQRRGPLQSSNSPSVQISWAARQEDWPAFVAQGIVSGG